MFQTIFSILWSPISLAKFVLYDTPRGIYFGFQGAYHGLQLAISSVKYIFNSVISMPTLVKTTAGYAHTFCINCAGFIKLFFSIKLWISILAAALITGTTRLANNLVADHVGDAKNMQYINLYIVIRVLGLVLIILSHYLIFKYIKSTNSIFHSVIIGIVGGLCNLYIIFGLRNS